MHLVRWLALVFVVGCRPYAAVGYDTTAHVHGALAPVLDQPMAVPRSADAPSAPAAAPSSTGDSYAFALGGGTRDLTIALGVHLHGVSDPLAAGAPRYLAASTALDLQWTFVRLQHLSTKLHAGPGEMMLVDKMSGARAWGRGVRWGGAVGATYAGITGYVDLSRSTFVFDTGPATGASDITTMTVGVALQ